MSGADKYRLLHRARSARAPAVGQRRSTELPAAGARLDRRAAGSLVAPPAAAAQRPFVARARCSRRTCRGGANGGLVDETTTSSPGHLHAPAALHIRRPKSPPLSSLFWRTSGARRAVGDGRAALRAPHARASP
jgi:hypothetical protein